MPSKSVAKNMHTKLKKNEDMEMALMFDCMAPLKFSQYLSDSPKRESKHGVRSNCLMVYNNLGYCKFLDGSPNDDVILRASFGCASEHQPGSIFCQRHHYI